MNVRETKPREKKAWHWKIKRPLFVTVLKKKVSENLKTSYSFVNFLLRGPSKVMPSKNQSFLNPYRRCHSLSLIFRIPPPPPSCRQPKNDKVFSDKTSAKMYYEFNIAHIYHIIPHARFPLPKSQMKKTIDLHFIASIRCLKMLCRLKSPKMLFWKATRYLNRGSFYVGFLRKYI